MSNLGMLREISSGKLLLVFHLMVNFMQIRAGQQLLITSRSGVQRTFSDSSKNESRDIIIHAHMQNTLIYSNIFEKTTQD